MICIVSASREIGRTTVTQQLSIRRSSSIEETRLSQWMAYERWSILRTRVTIAWRNSRGGRLSATARFAIDENMVRSIGELAPLWSLSCARKKPEERLGNIEVTRVCMKMQCALCVRVYCVSIAYSRDIATRASSQSEDDAKGAYAKGRRFLWYPDIRENNQASLKLSHF